MTDKARSYGISAPAGARISDAVCVGMTVNYPGGTTRYDRGPFCAACGEPTWDWTTIDIEGRTTIGSDATIVGMAITSNDIGGRVTNPGTHYHSACVPK